MATWMIAGLTDGRARADEEERGMEERDLRASVETGGEIPEESRKIIRATAKRARSKHWNIQEIMRSRKQKERNNMACHCGNLHGLA